MFHAAMATQIEKDHYTLIEQSAHIDVKITITKITTVLVFITSSHKSKIAVHDVYM